MGALNVWGARIPAHFHFALKPIRALHVAINGKGVNRCVDYVLNSLGGRGDINVNAPFSLPLSLVSSRGHGRAFEHPSLHTRIMERA